MRTVRTLAALAISVTFVGACTPAAEQEVATTEASVEAINRERQTLRAALYNGDLDIFMALWSEDAVLMPPNAPLVTGREAIRSWAQDLFNQFAIQLTIISEEVEVFGDWAFVRTTYTTALTPKAGGEVVEESGKNIWIWKREADGSWNAKTSVLMRFTSSDNERIDALKPEMKIQVTGVLSGWDNVHDRPEVDVTSFDVGE